MGQPDIQETFSSVSVEGFDQIYQPEPLQAQSGPELVQSDPILEAQTGPDLEIQPDPSQGVSLEEAAKVFGLHVDTVRKRLQKRKIKGFKIADKFGDKWFVHKDELEKAKTVQPYPTTPIQAAPEQIHPLPVVQAQTDPIVDVEIGPEQAQGVQQVQIQVDPERERLMQIIESQAHQLKAAGDVIMYLRNQAEEKDEAIKLLTDSQRNRSRWAGFWSWFINRRGNG